MTKPKHFSDPEVARRERKKAKPRGPNKIETDIKMMVQQALHELGGVEYLVRCGKARGAPRVAFLGLVKQILPKNITVEAGADILALLSGSWQRQVPVIQTEAIVTGPTPQQLEEETGGDNGNGSGYRHPLASGE